MPSQKRRILEDVIDLTKDTVKTPKTKKQLLSREFQRKELMKYLNDREIHLHIVDSKCPILMKYKLYYEPDILITICDEQDKVLKVIIIEIDENGHSGQVDGDNSREYNIYQAYKKEGISCVFIRVNVNRYKPFPEEHMRETTSLLMYYKDYPFNGYVLEYVNYSEKRVNKSIQLHSRFVDNILQINSLYYRDIVSNDGQLHVYNCMLMFFNACTIDIPQTHNAYDIGEVANAFIKWLQLPPLDIQKHQIPDYSSVCNYIATSNLFKTYRYKNFPYIIQLRVRHDLIPPKVPNWINVDHEQELFLELETN